MHSLALIPAWLANFAPIAGLLIVLSVALFILRSILRSRLPVTYSGAYRRRRIMNWLPLGLTYAFLYMGRYNINVAKTVLDPETGLALMTKAELGMITVIGTTTYALAFLINGPLADRFGGRKTILAAALGSSFANFGMGWVLDSGYEGSLVGPFGFLYAINMYFQSFGAVSIVKVNANWFHVNERGTFGAIFGILISLGLYFAYDWGGPIAENYGAQWAFYAPTAILLAFAAIDYFLVFDKPSDTGHEDFDPGDAKLTEEGERLGVVAMAKRMITHPVILTIILIETCSGFVRGGVMKWGFIFAKETGQELLSNNWGLWLCVAGISGGFFAGVISDFVFQSRRGPSAVILYAIATISLAGAAALIASPIAGVLVLFSILSVIGVHGMLSGTASMDFGGRKNAGLAVGLIDGMVYLGFGVQSIILGFVLPTGEEQTDPANWRIWLLVILPVAVMGLLLSLRIWNAKPRSTEPETKA
jgi:OPA family glycerol-3-phosphate transporter-like MFS transporter